MSFMSSGAALAMRGPQVLRFGAGKFRSVSAPTLLADAISSTGLPGGVQQLLCIGSAAPTPTWSAYDADPSSIPSTCAGGTPAFSDTARSVTLFDRHYAPPESWRGNVGWTASSFLGFYLSADATYSYNMHQSGTVDLNFAGTPKFSLPLEGNRPVYVTLPSIVPGTGTLSSVEARTSALYGRVADRVSDLHGDARQLALTAMPNLPFGAGLFFFGYTYADTRAQFRGFDGSTAGDPRVAEWAPGAFAPRHTVTAQWGRYAFGGAFSASVAVRASSGFTFTPSVSPATSTATGARTIVHSSSILRQRRTRRWRTGSTRCCAAARRPRRIV